MFVVVVAEEVKAQSEKLERERRQNEALTARLVDMEATGTRRETDLSELKRQLQAVKEEHQQVMQVRTRIFSSSLSPLKKKNWSCCLTCG